MRNPRPNLRFAMILTLVAVLLSGCGSLFRKSSDPEELSAMAEARMVLLTLGSQNDNLLSFKGIGKIKARQNGKIRIDERIAWIGSETAKLSIVVLISGHPAVKLASDGKWFYYYETWQGEPIFKKSAARDATLQRFVSIPIKTGDIIHLLAGRAPLREHHVALLHRQSSETGYVLTLKNRWGSIVEKVFLGEDKSRVHRIEFFNRSGGLIYRVRFDEMQNVSGYEVPSRLSISSEEEISVQLEIQKYLANVPVSPSMFVLKPPD